MRKALDMVPVTIIFILDKGENMINFLVVSFFLIGAAVSADEVKLESEATISGEGNKVSKERVPCGQFSFPEILIMAQELENAKIMVNFMGIRRNIAAKAQVNPKSNEELEKIAEKNISNAQKIIHKKFDECLAENT